MDDMIRNALVWANDKALPPTVELNGRKFIRHGGDRYHEVSRRLEEPGSLTFHTLAALASYLADNPDGYDLANAYLHVVSEVEVAAMLGGAEERDRHRRFAGASCRGTSFDVIHQSVTVEELCIYLRTLFDESGQRDELVQLLSSVESGEVRQQRDNGMSQEVTVRKNAGSVERRDFPLQWSLAPFSTFRDVAAQPLGNYIVRLNAKEGEGVRAKLIPIDDGQGALEAVALIRDRLVNLGVQIPVFA